MFLINLNAEIVACIFIMQKIAPQAKSEKYFQIWFFPDLGGKMAVFWACACKLSWTLLSPARVQPLYGARRKESSGTGLRLHRSSFLDVSEIFLVASSPFATRLEENSWGKSRLRTRVVGTAEAPFTLIRIEKFENAALFLRSYRPH